jgi:hypothetical protein
MSILSFDDELGANELFSPILSLFNSNFYSASMTAISLSTILEL